eukprot:CAMPEP_0195154926 /NCGR_PEP_ID=MMETSP0448-20130528/183902_1 /TAXON_ID=66468 /ORGANISM="Heterocapsa triquestra, Strain CCMP 448" /LENGTH=470 /DNA_ID=CAMNT_0040193707 /DNA_START=74 /DNA_END=1483 /DNA_ORIENTATION=+
MAFRVGLVLFAALFLHAAADELPTIYDTEKTSCLMYQGNGCNQIQDQNQCINSRDGRFFDMLQGGKIRGEPCVWCAGDNCTSIGNKCEPLGWLQAFPKFSLYMNYTVAGCWDDRTITDTVDNARRVLPTTEKMTFQPLDGGDGRVCRGSHEQDDGTGELGGINGGREWAYSIWTAKNLAECMTLCGPSCTGVEFKEVDKYCEVWFDPISFTNNMSGYQCYNKEMRCLTKQAKGCYDITSKDTCLSSRDGRQNTTYKDIDIYGQPCVWCGGAPCTSNNDNLCEPLDFVMKGEGTVFTTFHAQCYNKEMRCLTKQAKGCYDITSKDTCLSSRDGRQNTTYKDIDIYGQPCVWCGGAPCTSNNDNLCEPLDFVMKGEGTVFTTFHAKYDMEIATCSTDTEVGPPLPPQRWVLMPPPAMPTMPPTLAPVVPLTPGGVPVAPPAPEAPPSGGDDLPDIPDFDPTSKDLPADDDDA